MAGIPGAGGKEAAQRRRMFEMEGGDRGNAEVAEDTGKRRNL